jgi:hypothetical protein
VKIMPELVPDGATKFTADAPAYLRDHPSILSAVGGVEGDINDFAWQQNADKPDLRDWLRCTPKAASFADIEAWAPAGLCAGARELRIVAAKSDAGIRYLPYQANKLTYIKLDGAAQWFFTGPIEGCFVYVVRHDGSTYVFHVNANAVPDPTENARAKDTKLRVARDALLPDGTIVHRLSLGDYAPPGDDKRPFRGFVYGKRTDDAWEFRYHSFIIDGASAVPLKPASPLPDASGMLT